MVRETRHLWVGNLPDNIREDRIREHFKRYGRVQNVKLLGRAESASAAVAAGASAGACGVCATVAFMDIKSASKAHNAEHVLDERTLTTEYYEPAAIPTAASSAPSAGSSPAGSGYSGSSSSVNSTAAPASSTRYHVPAGDETPTSCPAATAAAPATWRGTNDSATDFRRGTSTYGRYRNSTAPYSTPPSNVDRTPHHRWYACGAGAGGESTPSTPGGAGEPSARRRRRSGSGDASSRSDSSSPDNSDESRASSPHTAGQQPHTPNSHGVGSHRSSQQQWSSSSGRPLAICVRNLPARSTDSSLKDGLYHEYKKHGKVVWVKVVGQNSDRYAIVRFKKPSDVEKALEVSQDKLFFGCKISVAPHQSCDEDAESAKPYETDIDEYHPKATRTLFIGNLEKDVTQQHLRDKFKHFGRIIEIDIKKGSGGGAGYAFCQFAAISSVVEAIRAMDGEYVGSSRVKLGFGKPVATTCVWVDGLTEHTEKQVVTCVGRCGAATSVCVDRAAGAALVHFEQAAAASAAVRELRRLAAHLTTHAHDADAPRLAVDYASRECQEAFYEQLEKHGGSAALAGSERLGGDVSTRYLPATRHDSIRSRASSYGRGSSRTPRYSSVDHYDGVDYAADRRYRVFDELGSSPQTDEPPYEDRLQSVVVSRRHRRDSSPDEHKSSKQEWHRTVSGGVVCLTGTRSRSASRRRHRRRRDESASRGGTPLRDEPGELPAEPRPPPAPRDRDRSPMCLPLPKFAELLRAPAPAEPPRPPSASSSSAGSAPHSPSLEERIRSLDEKYERWSRLDPPTAPSRPRHRLLDVDVHEVQPSDVVRSLLAKRSVFDEDSERLEGSGRSLQYPFPQHPRPNGLTRMSSLPAAEYSNTSKLTEPDDRTRLLSRSLDLPDKPTDPRVNCRLSLSSERSKKHGDEEPRSERLRPRTPSVEKPPSECSESPSVKTDFDDIKDSPREPEKYIRRRVSICSIKEPDNILDSVTSESKSSVSDESQESTGKDCALASHEIVTDVPNSDDVVQSGSVVNSDVGVSNDNDELLKPIEEVVTDEVQLPKEDKIDEVIETASQETIELKPDEITKSIDEKIAEICQQHVAENEKALLLQMEIATPKDNEESTESTEKIEIENESVENFMKDVTANQQDQINKLDPGSSKKSRRDSFEKRDNDQLTSIEKNTKDKVLCAPTVFPRALVEKENIEFDKVDKEKYANYSMLQEIKPNVEKVTDDHVKLDHDKARRSEKDCVDKEKARSSKNEKDRGHDKHEKDKSRDIFSADLLFHSHSKHDKVRSEKRHEKDSHGKSDRDAEKTHKNTSEKSRHSDDKKYDHHRKDHKHDRRKDSTDLIDSKKDDNKSRKEDKHKHDRHRKDHNDKRDTKKESDSKSRKSSRDESIRDINRKDSTDSSTSRASYESSKLKDIDVLETKDKEDAKHKNHKNTSEPVKHRMDNETSIKSLFKTEDIKVKTEVKDEKVQTKEEKVHPKEEKQIAKEENSQLQDEKGPQDIAVKIKTEIESDQIKGKSDITEKQRHYSVDSISLDNKRKERLSSSASLPSSIGGKRRMSSQDNYEYTNEEVKKAKIDSSIPDRRNSKDSRSGDRHKTTKFNKSNFAKLFESKTKDEKKNQVKSPDTDRINIKDEPKDQKVTDKLKLLRKSPKYEVDDKYIIPKLESLQNDLDFLATLELRSSEEDEKQKALRKEMKEKKRIQQLQQIQELQQQQGALQGVEYFNKIKEEKKQQKAEEKRKEAAREKRLSIDRKSREEKIDPTKKKKERKQGQSTDTSDSDEPRKHSIFDIVDEGPTYISMYDKVKARSCKNMQKQEEEKRQEKIKAKFSQLKQSRAKREEKKRSSWDEDSDTDSERKKSQRLSVESSSEEERRRKDDKLLERGFVSEDGDKKNDYYAEIDSRNKLSRKNSRSRIISDTSDDDSQKRLNKVFDQIKKEIYSDTESIIATRRNSDCYSKIDTQDIILPKDFSGDKIKKHSLLNLFGKSDSDENKLKSCPAEPDTDFKSNYMKKSMDFSSESESMTSNAYGSEIRKKHKKKQKRSKSVHSDEDLKGDVIDSGVQDLEQKHKFRKSNKKEKRRDKIRDSVDTDESREDRKSKKNKVLATTSLGNSDNINNAKKDGKMEDIFGPLSDDSDCAAKRVPDGYEFGTKLPRPNQANHMDNKDKDDSRRKKERRRKEKRYFSKEDDNSLDVDAVSKAIEARLFAENITDDEKLHIDLPSESKTCDFAYDGDINADDRRSHDKFKKDGKEKRKKKKRSKEERQVRKDHHNHHHHHLHQHDKAEPAKPIAAPVAAPTIELKETIICLNEDSKDETKSVATDSQSGPHSLPSLVENPSTVSQKVNESDMEMNISDASDRLTIVENEITTPNHRDTDSDEIVTPTKIIPAKNSTETPQVETKSELMSSFESDMNQTISDDAVRSISNLDEEVKSDKAGSKTPKEEKPEDKPRAVISQEETEDAVAALLGESFGASQGFCFDDDAGSGSADAAENNVPEEDAEEMRRAVQNLNASEMEMKPDTPMSDNDLLLIDTDTEDADDNTQDADKSAAKDNKVVQETATPKTNVDVPNPSTATSTSKASEEVSKRDVKIQATSSATPVITSWAIAQDKLNESKPVTMTSQTPPREVSEVKPVNVTASIIQLKPSPGHNVPTSNAPMRPNIPLPTAPRMAPYQVIYEKVRPQAPNMQPPTIKIPDQHILYQKQQNIVISPRLISDPRLQSPKGMSQDGMGSPRVTNVAILSTSPQNMNVGMNSPPGVGRAPGHVTVVRMQQPPLSPLQALHLPPARSMLHASRPSSVLVQTQGAPLHFNRLPVAPVLAPINKPLNPNNIVQGKGLTVVTSSLIHQQKTLSPEYRKAEPRAEMSGESPKIILSPTNLQHSTNPTVMAQNRLISMQNSLNAANINNSLKLTNKVLINPVVERKDMSMSGFKPDQKKPDQLNHIPFSNTPIIHMAGVAHSSGHILQGGSKPLLIQETHTREQGTNVIQTANSQRFNTVPISNVIQIDANKIPPTVLSMSTSRSASVLSKYDNAAATTPALANVVMTPVLLKPSAPIPPPRLHKPEPDPKTTATGSSRDFEERHDPRSSSSGVDKLDNRKELLIKSSPTPIDSIAKCETDFEELLKDTTNEIKVSRDPDKKVEVSIGKPVFPPQLQHLEPNQPPKSVLQPSRIEQHKQETFDNKERSSIIETGTSSSSEIQNSLPKLEKDIHTAHTNLFSPSTDKTLENLSSPKDDDTPLSSLLGDRSDLDKDRKQMDEMDSWSAKDVNIESVIKKVDSLCNDSTDEASETESRPSPLQSAFKTETINNTFKLDPVIHNTEVKPMENHSSKEEAMELSVAEELSNDKGNASKRGGRSVRGKKGAKTDRAAPRAIAKPARGAARRGRGRAPDRRLQQAASHMPADVYDFHEDSGDEHKAEARPRLILTIKSPLSGQVAAVACSSLSIKEQPKLPEKLPPAPPPKEEKEDFASPSSNTRKSRRLQEKDTQRSTTDEDEAGKSNKAKRRAARVKPQDRKPRGGKRTRSASDASLDSSDEKHKKDEPEPKIAKLEAPLKSEAAPKLPADDNSPVQAATNLHAAVQPTVSVIAPAPAHPPPPVSPPPVVSQPQAVVPQQAAIPPQPVIIPQTVISPQTAVPPPASKPPQAVIPPQAIKPPQAVIPPQAIRPPQAVIPPQAIKPPQAVIPSQAIKPPQAVVPPQAIKPLQAVVPPQAIKPPQVVKPPQAALPPQAVVPPQAAILSQAIVPPQHSVLPQATIPAQAIPPLAVSLPQAAPPQASIPPTPIMKPPKKMISEISAKLASAFEAASSVPGRLAAEAELAAPPALPHRAPAPPPRAPRPAYPGAASLPRGAHHPPGPPGPPAPPPHQPLQIKPPHHHYNHPGPGARMNVTSVPSVSPQGQQVQVPLPADVVRSPPPAHQQTSPVTPGDGMYGQFSHQHYQMFQQHFRATQHDNRTSPSPYTRALEAEGPEPPAPALQLRRPPGARVPRPAHSPAPPDRYILYGAVGGRSPPPAHARAAGPPHASQVPREADSLQMLLRRYPVMWQGLLALKNDSAAVQMHFVGGNPAVAGNTLPRHVDGSTPPLRIAQRMRLEPAQLDQVHRKMMMESEHCMLLALPCGRDHMDVLQQSTNLTHGFITYMQRKQAAGIVNVALPPHEQATYTVHIFPSCDFANENLNRIAPDLMHRVADIAHLLIVIATV